MTVTHAVATKRLMLESGASPALGDVWNMVKWLSDPEVVKYSEQRHKTHTVKSQLEYVCSFVWPSQFRVILLDNKLIGTMTAHVDTNNSVADIGIMIGDKTQWGKGYGTEAWNGLMAHLFNLGIRKIEAGCMQLNTPMLAIFSKNKMKREGFRSGHFMLDGTPVGMELWARFQHG